MKYLDVFAGAGGLSEGFAQNGHTPIAHVEMNEVACKTLLTRNAFHYLRGKDRLDVYTDYLLKNISQEQLLNEVPKRLVTSVINTEITSRSLSGVIDAIDAHLPTRGIDLIIGGPPCQAYSRLKRHAIDEVGDSRNYLYRYYAQFLKRYSPRAFLFENVPGLLSANDGKHFKNMKAYFRRIGYTIYDQVVDASHFDVLQARERLFIIGIRKDIEHEDFEIPERIRTVHSVSELLSDLPAIDTAAPAAHVTYSGRPTTYLNQTRLRTQNDVLTQHIARPVNANDRAIYRHAIEAWNSREHRIRYSDLPAQLQTHRNKHAFLDRYKVVNPKGLSHTVVAHISKDGHYYIHPSIDQSRSLSVREAARIQAFPDNYYFEGGRTAQFHQIGNAVPPKLASHLAAAITQAIS